MYWNTHVWVALDWNCFLVWFSVHFSRFSPIQGAKVPPARFVQGAVPLQQLDHKHGQRRHLPFRDNPDGPDGGLPCESDLPPALRLRPRGSRTGRLVAVDGKSRGGSGESWRVDRSTSQCQVAAWGGGRWTKKITFIWSDKSGCFTTIWKLWFPLPVLPTDPTRCSDHLLAGLRAAKSGLIVNSREVPEISQSLTIPSSPPLTPPNQNPTWHFP